LFTFGYPLKTADTDCDNKGCGISLSCSGSTDPNLF